MGVRDSFNKVMGIDLLENQGVEYQNKVDKLFGKEGEEKKTYNPFLKADGTLVNKYIDYQKLLDNPNVTTKAKEFITNATGLTPTQAIKQNNTVNSVVSSEDLSKYKENNTNSSFSSTDGNYTPAKVSGELKVGSRIADTATYNNSAAKGQCVWYVRGRASEKLGKTVGSLGNANEMWYNAKSASKVAATVDNIKPDMIVSYSKGTSQAGQKYGHVIYIEDVVGDTVYYTEGGSGYYKNGTDGVVKTASKQGIIEGINTNGSRMGSGIIGFIDLSKY